MLWSFSYSIEGPFYGNYETREGAIDAAIAEMTAEGKPLDAVFFIGDDRLPKADFTGLDLPEHLATWVEDFQVEQAEDWPAFSATDEQKADLTRAIEAAFVAWLERHNMVPDWRVIENPERLTLGAAREIMKTWTRGGNGGVK